MVRTQLDLPPAGAGLGPDGIGQRSCNRLQAVIGVERFDHTWLGFRSGELETLSQESSQARWEALGRGCE